jgi:D-hexose-6-phosphate mutarotase
LEDAGYRHVTVNHSVTFLEEETVALTHMVESTWLQANAALHTYSHMADYMFGLADYDQE